MKTGLPDALPEIRLASATTLETAVVQVIDWLTDASVAFGHGVDNAEEEAMWLVLSACNEELGQADYDWGNWLGSEQINAVEKLVSARISTRKPLAYLLREAWFAGIPFYVDERTLVPRSFMAEWIPEQFVPWVEPSEVDTILDLCCGSGCIGIAAAMAFDGTSVVLSDLSSDALAVARINLERHELSDRVSLNHGAMFTGLESANKFRKFDLILCNPPYVSDIRMDALPEEYRVEPELGLRGGSDGLDFIRPLLQQAGDYLTASGFLIVEAGSASFAVEQAWPQLPFTWLGTEHDEMVLFLISASELAQYKHLLEN